MKDRVARGLPHRRLERLLLVGFLLHGLVATVAKLGFEGSEVVFPAFSWSLFSRVPNEVRDFAIVLREVDGEPYAVDLRDAASLFPQGASIAAHHLTQDLGAALQGGDEGRARELRELVEGSVLHSRSSLRWGVVARRYDPLERWEGGRIREARSIAEFETPSGAEQISGRPR